MNERARSSDRRNDAEAPAGAVRPVSWAGRVEDAEDAAAGLPPATGDRSWRGAGRPPGGGGATGPVARRSSSAPADRREPRRPAPPAPPGRRGEAPGEADLATRLRDAGPGQALQPGVQRRLEEGLGADLSGVRVHADAEADGLSRSLEAEAFTSGRDVYFRAGAYDPASSDGMRLLAHEAVHTVQQAAGPVAGTSAPGGVAVSDPGDAFERQGRPRRRHRWWLGLPPRARPPPRRAQRSQAPANPGIAQQRLLQRADEEGGYPSPRPCARHRPQIPRSSARPLGPASPMRMAGRNPSHWTTWPTSRPTPQASLRPWRRGADISIDTTLRSMNARGSCTRLGPLPTGAAPTDDPYGTAIVWDHTAPPRPPRPPWRR